MRPFSWQLPAPSEEMAQLAITITEGLAHFVVPQPIYRAAGNAAVSFDTNTATSPGYKYWRTDDVIDDIKGNTCASVVSDSKLRTAQ